MSQRRIVQQQRSLYARHIFRFRLPAIKGHRAGQFRIQAPLLLHYAALDNNINAGWPAYEAALKQHQKISGKATAAALATPPP
jgi:hypothetical protein